MRRAETEAMVAAYAPNPGRAAAPMANHQTSGLHRPLPADAVPPPAAPAPQQPLAAALLLLAAPLAQCRPACG